MKADLRERLMALADDRDNCGHGYSYSDLCHVALAAARLALDDAAQACEDRANDKLPNPLFCLGARQCAAAIRAMREELK